MNAAVLITVAGAAVVLGAMIYLARELVAADQRVDEWRKAHYRVLGELVKAETDLTIARMLHGGEVARLTRQLEALERRP
jgi:hypothetical protein